MSQGLLCRLGLVLNPPPVTHPERHISLPAVCSCNPFFFLSVCVCVCERVLLCVFFIFDRCVQTRPCSGAGEWYYSADRWQVAGHQVRPCLAVSGAPFECEIPLGTLPPCHSPLCSGGMCVCVVGLQMHLHRSECMCEKVPGFCPFLENSRLF